MTFPVSGIVPFGTGGVAAIDSTSIVPASQAASSAGGADFATILASTVDGLQATQAKADSLATQAATGDLKDVHDYMIASNEASLATEMVVTIKNKAVEAFNEIMRMPV
ncbi:MAG: fliE [Blastococcus sp.]|jgi:flagellar hook-basal body complex protein FliE|nr:fliE [Blastococcus sp.]